MNAHVTPTSALSTTEKVAQLLLAFNAEGSPSVTDHSVSELARAVGRERSQVSRMLHSLSRCGVVEQDDASRRYRLGWPMRVLAAGAGNQLLIDASRPVLRTLVVRTGEVALLSVQEGNRSLTVLREESQNALQGGGWVGRRSAMHNSASGRALLFDTDDETVAALTEDDLATASSTELSAPPDLATLLTRLREERQRGFAVAVEELEVGLTSVSAPVRNAQRSIIAVLNVSGPTSRVHENAASFGRLLVAASARVSQNLHDPNAQR